MSEPKIVAIDTATEGCSAALLVGTAVTEQFEITPRGHTQRILPMVDQLLAEAALKLADLDAIAFNRGPGSFTGLRITAGVVQGLAYGAALPVIPVSSLAALAAAHYRQHATQLVLSAIDARMGELYWGAYRIGSSGIPQLQGEEVVAPVEALPEIEGEWSGVGSGWGAYREALDQRFGEKIIAIDDQALPHAAEIARLALHHYKRGEILPAEAAQPVYLRNNVVHQK